MNRYKHLIRVQEDDKNMAEVSSQKAINGDTPQTQKELTEDLRS